MASNANCLLFIPPWFEGFSFCSQRERARDDQEPLVWPSFHWPLKCSGLTWTNLKSRGHQWKEEASRAEKERKEANVLAKGWWCASHFWIGGPVAEDLLAAFHWQHWPFPPADETIKDGRRKLLALLFFLAAETLSQPVASAQLAGGRLVAHVSTTEKRPLMTPTRLFRPLINELALCSADSKVNLPRRKEEANQSITGPNQQPN